MAIAPHRICIVGIGYVGLPLAYALAKAGHEVTGYDIRKERVDELAAGHDSTGELSDTQLKEVRIRFSADPAALGEADIVIMAIPTPVDDNNLPDLGLLKNASQTVGEHLGKGTIVVYESTVYPGTTEEICGPILEKASGLTRGKDFHLGYSPERINPGDKTRTVDKIVKVVSADDEKTCDILCEVYGSAIPAGIHRAPSIQVAEMAKAIENAQRDLNVAFVNEVAMLCNRIGIPTKKVLEAAATKWNFLPFKPGLVGGHCIGVDPYYLVEKARQLGMMTHIITAGRATNDGMSSYISVQVCNAMGGPSSKRVLVLGLTFKEDIPDDRNSKAPQVALQLQAMGCDVFVHDPFVPEEKVRKQGLSPGTLKDGPFDAILYLVTHKQYRDLPLQALIDATKEGGVIYDLKSVLDGEVIEKAGRRYMAL